MSFTIPELPKSGPRRFEDGRVHPISERRDPIAGPVSIMDYRDREAQDKLRVGIIASFAPANEFELQLANSIATDMWRLNRLAAVEENLFDTSPVYEEAPEGPDFELSRRMSASFVLGMKELECLAQQENRLRRHLHKSIALLREMQAERKKSETKQSSVKEKEAPRETSQPPVETPAADKPKAKIIPIAQPPRKLQPKSRLNRKPIPKARSR